MTETTWVCDPERVKECRCDDEGFCDCTEPNIAGNCDCCGAPMVLVRNATGEPVKAATA